MRVFGIRGLQIKGKRSVGTRCIMQKITETIRCGEKEIILETGCVARQADAAVTVRCGDAVVLVAVTCNRTQTSSGNFLPLTVLYLERSYSMGKIPGGFFKREGRPTERETLISRLIDRSVRPLFPDGFAHEIQLVATLLSHDPEVEPDILAMIGASSVLQISGLPQKKVFASARVTSVDGEFYLNAKAKEATLELVVSASDSAILMVEAQADEASEEHMLDAVDFAHSSLRACIKGISSFRGKVGNPPFDWRARLADPEALGPEIFQQCQDAVEDGFLIADKKLRGSFFHQLQSRLTKSFLQDNEQADDRAAVAASQAVAKAVSMARRRIFRRKMLDGQRIGGRRSDEVRAVSSEVGWLPRVHGSALFTRGETQALVAVTLGGERDSQIVESAGLESTREKFMLHYNFPPYSVGEVGFMGSPKRREIGHGKLAKRALTPVMPSDEDFPYTIRLVSEITESNGSSSMATVCASSLALMDAGIKIKRPVAGIAMGLLVSDDGGDFLVLSDIMGDEDSLGDMDFKAAGTELGITALQMDIKSDGITYPMLRNALEQARDGRKWILEKMAEALDSSREDVSAFAPRIFKMKIPTAKIRDLIGKGGSTIRSISEQTHVEIKVEDDGTVSLVAPNKELLEQAKSKISAVVTDVQVGKIFLGKVVSVVNFGAFVNIMPGKDGLLHISQIADCRIQNVEDYVNAGDEVLVKVLEVDHMSRVRLSMKAITPEERERQG